LTAEDLRSAPLPEERCQRLSETPSAGCRAIPGRRQGQGRAGPGGCTCKAQAMHLDDMTVEISAECSVKAMAILLWVGLHSDAVYVKKGFVCECV
jgi:hypothetical protein